MITMMATNLFVARLNEPGVSFGTWLMSASPTCAEALGWSGLDFIVVDMEHVPLSLPDVVAIHRAISAAPAGTITRLPWNDTVMVKRLLDAGAQTLMFPMIQSPEEALAAVRATRYPPHGVRGVAAVHRASRYGAVTDYLHASGPELAVIVQVETGVAFAQLDAIASVQGVDMVFIGPGDLAASLGHLGNPGHPEVQAMLQAAPDVCHRNGCKIGTLAPNAEQARTYAGQGYDFVAIGSDVASMNAMIRSQLQSLGRAPVSAGVPAPAGY